jgi:CheY-like chemotaxis protein
LEIASVQLPDVILMDMMMPQMDGLTACYAIKNDPVTQSILVVMVTAIGFELNIKLSQQMGASGYVTKPFTPQDLFDKITQVLEKV